MCGGGRDQAQICLLFLNISHSASRQNWGVCAKSYSVSLRHNQSLSPGSLSPDFLLLACSWQLAMAAESGLRNLGSFLAPPLTHCVASVYLCFLICKIGPLIKRYGISMRIEITGKIACYFCVLLNYSPSRHLLCTHHIPVTVLVIGIQGWIVQGLLQVELPDLANKNTGHSAKLEFQIHDEWFFSMNMSHAIFGMYLH